MTTMKTLAIRVACLAALLMLPVAANAMPQYYQFVSGSASLTASLQGSSDSVLLNPPATVQMSGATVAFDPAAGSYGTVLDLNMGFEDFSLLLDPSVVDFESVDVMDAEVQSTDLGSLDSLGDFLVPTDMTAVVTATDTGGNVFGPAPVSSLPDGSSIADMNLRITGDQVLVRLSGFTFANFPSLSDPTAPLVQVKGDITFIAERVEAPVPEPGAALLFAVGTVVVGSIRRRR